MERSLKVFLCYAHEDEKLRLELEKQLGVLKHQGLINVWHDREISAGMEWEREIDKQLNSADIILLLVSPAFVDSEYCYSVEMKRALERHERREVRVIPILLRPTLWQDTPLGKLQALPRDAKPVSDPSWRSMGRAFLDVTKGIRKVIEELRTTPLVQKYPAGEFARISPYDLKTAPAIVQALDNQWLSRSLLKRTMQIGYLAPDIEKERMKFVRAEYIKALINSEQLVIPLSYIYNNSVIYQDFLHKGQKREAFKTLLTSGVIIPFLSTENTPVDQIHSDKDAHGWEAWQQLCREGYMYCLRLAWDDTVNEALTRQMLSHRLAVFCTSVLAHNLDLHLRDFHLDPSTGKSLRQRFREMTEFVYDLLDEDKNREVTRTELYRAFVTEGDKSIDREYDNSKPFASEIKQLIDLAYNRNLADALNSYLVTPLDSLPRSALQENISSIIREEITGEDICSLLQHMSPHLVGRRLYIESIDSLSLQDVCEIRHMDEWSAYMQSREILMSDPLLNMAENIASVYENYNQLAQQITNLVASQERKEQNLITWLPTVELVFNIGGAVLSFIWTRKGPVYQFSDRTPMFLNSPVTVQVIIRDKPENLARHDLSISVDLLNFRMKDALNQWAEIKRWVREYQIHLKNVDVSQK